MMATKSMLQQIHKLKEALQKEHNLINAVHENLTLTVWQGNDAPSLVSDAKKQIEDFKLFNDMEIMKLLQ